MSQVENGIRSVLALPPVYNSLQWLMGANKNRRDFVDNYVEPNAGDHLLDIGCGTGEILDFLPQAIHYFGFDQSQPYINHARKKYGGRGQFENAFVDSLAVANLPAMNIVLASGLIHHLEDQQVNTLLQTAKSALKENGRFISIDPCYIKGQNKLAKWLIDRDRGNNVRSVDQYSELFEQEFSSIKVHVVHRRWIPYTHLIVVATR